MFALIDKSGKSLAGDLHPNSVANGMSTVLASQLGLKGDSEYRVMPVLGPNRLIIGQSFNETDDLEDIAFRSFILAMVCVVVLAGAGVCSSRPARNVASMASPTRYGGFARPTRGRACPYVSTATT